MNHVKFASLINFITFVAIKGNGVMQDSDIEEIEKLVRDLIPVQSTGSVNIDPVLLEDMFQSMAMNRKIDAIKACRAMTGLGLKEAKDFIERYTVSKTA